MSWYLGLHWDPVSPSPPLHGRGLPPPLRPVPTVVALCETQSFVNMPLLFEPLTVDSVHVIFKVQLYAFVVTWCMLRAVHPCGARALILYQCLDLRGSPFHPAYVVYMLHATLLLTSPCLQCNPVCLATATHCTCCSVH